MDYDQVNLNAPASIWHVMFNMTKMELELTPGPGMYIFFAKDTRKEFLIFLIDIVKPAKSVWNLMTQNKNQNILYT